MTQDREDELSLNKPDEPYEYGDWIDWDENYGWVSVCGPSGRVINAYWSESDDDDGEWAWEVIR